MLFRSVVSAADYSIARAATEFAHRQESPETAAYHQETLPFIRFHREHQIKRRRCCGPTDSTTNSRGPDPLASGSRPCDPGKQPRDPGAQPALAPPQPGGCSRRWKDKCGPSLDSVRDTGRCRHGSARGGIHATCPSPAAATPHGPISCRAVTLDSSPGLPF